MRSLLSFFVAICALASQAQAQTMSRADIFAHAQPITFAEDEAGYGRALFESILPGWLDRWQKGGINIHIKVAQTALAGNGQPEFMVRMESPNTCTQSGCDTMLFMLVGQSWKRVLQAHANDFRIGPVDPSSHMALLAAAPHSVWAWNGERYALLP